MDASPSAVKVILKQVNENKRERVVALFSEEHSPAEQIYTTNDREGIEVFSILERCRCYLE